MTRDVLLATTALMLTPMLAAAPAAAKDPLVFTPIAAPADDATKREVIASDPGEGRAALRRLPLRDPPGRRLRHQGAAGR